MVRAKGIKAKSQKGRQWPQMTWSNSPVSHSARHQRPAWERHKIRIASQEKCRQSSAAQYKFYTLARFSLLLNVDIPILYPNT